MNYIVLDSEWNSVFYKKKRRYINELVEIGAVKLNDKFEIIDEFQSVIKSQITEKLSNRFINLTNISNEEMLSGVSLGEAIESFKNWAGEDTVVFTWSDSDLYTLYQNCDEFLGLDYIPGFFKYADAQKIVQAYMKQNGFVIESQISLENAAFHLEIPVDNIELHRAKDDSRLTAKLLKSVENIDFNTYIRDCTAKDFYAKIAFKPYIINNINNKYVKRNKMRFKCDECGARAKQKTDWVFKKGGFNAEFYCKKCDISFDGVVIFKKLYKSVSIKKFKKNVKQKKSSEI